MKYLKWLFVIAFSLHIFGMIAQAAKKSANSTTVGVVLRTFMDESRKNWRGTGSRPLATIIWYPAAAGARIKEPDYGAPPELMKYFVSYPLAEGAAISHHSPKYPLVVLSHGSGSAALELAWLGYYLASRGYIVAGVNHHGDTGAEPGGPVPQGFGTPWERAKDLSVLIDKMLGDSLFGPRIDANRIAAAGHSAGGATVIELAGGIFSPSQIHEWCKSNGGADTNCHLPPMIQKNIDTLIELAKTDPIVRDSMRRSQLPYNDPRVKAVFAMAPAIGIGHTDASLKAIHIPVGIVAGRADDITPLLTNAERFANLITTSTLTVLPGNVGHATFGSLCTPAAINGPDWVRWVCHDEAGVDRAAVHQQTAQLAAELFREAFAASMSPSKAATGYQFKTGRRK
jgi:predicted dienelactone hydrolase